MSRLSKELSLAQGVGLLTTSLLGTGIFIVPAVAATLAGRASLWAWLLLILLVLPIAFTFAQLGKRFPHAGGAPSLIGRAFGGRMEQGTAFLFLAVIPVGLPAALKMASGFWHALFDLSSAQELLIQLATLGLMLWLGQRPAQASGRVQTAIAVSIIATVAAIWWRGGLLGGEQPLQHLDDLSWGAIPAALAVMFWCFVGIEAFTHMGEEFRNPQRDFLPSLLIGVLLAGLVYWSFSAAVLHFGMYGDAQSNATSLPAMIGSLWGPRTSWLAALIGYLACFASVNIYLQGFARLIWSLADEGKLPSSLAQRNGQGVPARALAVVVAGCALATILAWWNTTSVDELIRYANGNFVLVYLFSMAAGWVLLPGFWRWLAGISALLCGLTLVMLGMQMLYALSMLALFMLVGYLRPMILRGRRGTL
ncbi:L-methionine/branched-chain amino acid transporter [Marinobacterium sp. D7]|uniref:L-methionine/branched-chain amino acid transporter n=1 Tax=Marinobacterium ramblicola TaxID=2849041 RepID=UPI001C2D6ED5|nr:L-methionine/branched-chain amino acid transporter [Marinobacterium ramblicola]MBV1786851.1 L-methionine/branched-chain amino acid transporter [Marinobacterium ramblicola]